MLKFNRREIELSPFIACSFSLAPLPAPNRPVEIFIKYNLNKGKMVMLRLRAGYLSFFAVAQDIAA